MLNPIYFLMYSTGEKANITQIEGNFPQEPFATRAEREAFVQDWVQVPDERFKQWFLDWEQRGEKSIPNHPPVDATCEIVNWQEKMHYVDDCTGICAGLSSFPLKPPFHMHNLPALIAAGAGFDLDADKLTTITKRTRTLVRALNNRRGLTRADDKPPEDHWKKRFPELERKLLDEYYKFKGWNPNGIPTAETLRALGLGYVVEDFMLRGILPAESVGSKS
jgi:aldehyde:ferredoxin oxidoreductase